MAASDNLVITYTGNNERTNVGRPPAVPVGELIDVIDATVQHPEGSPKRVRIEQPLQPFDRRNYTLLPLPNVAQPLGALTASTSRAPRRSSSRPAPRGPFLESPLPQKSVEVLELEG